jgi:phage terminase large subunit-like protein
MGDLAGMLSDGLTKMARRPNIYGYKPHPKQEVFHSKVAKNRLFLGGNRSGKSTAGVIEDLWWATGTHPYRETPEPPVRIRVIGVDFPNGVEKILLPEFQRWVPVTALVGDSWEKAYSKKHKRLDFKNDSFIEFMSSDQDLDKFAGTSRHLIHFDEEPPADIWNENKARTIDTAGEMILTMTPLLGLTWVYDDLYMQQNETNFVVEIGMDENPYLAEAEVEAFLSGLSKDERKSRGEGKFIAIGGLIFKDFKPEIHVIDPVIPPLEWEWYQSLDHGINNPTAILWHAVSPEGQIVTFSEHYASDLTIASHATTIHSRESAWGRVPDYRVCDPALRQRQALTGDSLIVEYEKLGISLIPGNNEVATGIAKMQLALKPQGMKQEPQWLITENCANLIKEMQRYRYATYLSSKVAARSNKMETPVKKDDHAIDSARYFITFLPDLAPYEASIFGDNTTPSPAPPGYDQTLWQGINNSQPSNDDWRYEF